MVGGVPPLPNKSSRRRRETDLLLPSDERSTFVSHARVIPPPAVAACAAALLAPTSTLAVFEALMITLSRQRSGPICLGRAREFSLYDVALVALRFCNTRSRP